MIYTITLNSDNPQALAFVEFAKTFDFLKVTPKKESKKILKSLEESKKDSQLNLFDSIEYTEYDKLEEMEEKINELRNKINNIKNIDTNNMTPLDALILINKLKDEI